MGWDGRADTRLGRLDWYPGDYLADRRTRSLTWQEHGIYMLLLWMEWLDGPLPEDPEAVFKMLGGGGSREDFDRAWPVVRTLFDRGKQQGTLVNSRLERERMIALAVRDEKVKAGRNGGLASGRKRRPVNDLEAGASFRCSSEGDSASFPLQPASASASASAFSSPTGEGVQAALPGVPVEQSERPAPTRAAVERWNARRSERGLGALARGQVGQLVKAVANIWPACKHTEATLLGAIDAYFGDRATFTVEQGWNVGEFMRRSDHWVMLALGTRPTASGGKFAEMDAAADRVIRKLGGSPTRPQGPGQYRPISAEPPMLEAGEG